MVERQDPDPLFPFPYTRKVYMEIRRIFFNIFIIPERLCKGGHKLREKEHAYITCQHIYTLYQGCYVKGITHIEKIDMVISLVIIPER